MIRWWHSDDGDDDDDDNLIANDDDDEQIIIVHALTIPTMEVLVGHSLTMSPPSFVLTRSSGLWLVMMMAKSQARAVRSTSFDVSNEKYVFNNVWATQICVAILSVQCFNGDGRQSYALVCRRHLATEKLVRLQNSRLMPMTTSAGRGGRR